MKNTFINIIKKPKNIFFLIISIVIIFILIRFFLIYNILYDFYSLDGISFSRNLEVFYQYIFEPFFNGTFQDKFSTITLSVLTSFNILLFVIFIKKQRNVLHKKGFFVSFLGVLIGLFGVGCISCGAFIMAPLLTFLGLVVYTNYFIIHAVLLSNIGIILIFISVLYLLKQLSKPTVCR